MLQNADVLLHAGQSHAEFFGKVSDRSVRASELFQNAPPDGIGERGKRSIESGFSILNHVVQYITRIDDMQPAESTTTDPSALDY